MLQEDCNTRLLVFKLQRTSPIQLVEQAVLAVLPVR